ncbi:MAG: CreA family protein [Alphaproteobacteria bacterium]
MSLMRTLAMLALVLLSACGRNDGNVGAISNDWTGNAIRVEAINDPKVKGVTCHFSYFDRSFIDRVANGKWFEDPSNNSIACRQTGPIVIGDIAMGKSGEEVFSKHTSLFFKAVAVRRIYDPENNTLIYVSYGREIVRGSAKMSLSTVTLYGQNVTWTGHPPGAPS